MEPHKDNQLVFFFDYSSPFSYLGSTQVERVALQAGASIVWKPFLLGALFRAIGTPMVPLAAMSEPKRAFMLRDLVRWAEHWQVPFTYASRFPLRTVKALRLTLLAETSRVPALVHRLYRLCWVDDGNPDDDTDLAECARDVGVSPDLVTRTSEETARQALMRTTDEAIALGVPGAPTFVISDAIFWGQDRLVFVEKALAGSAPRRE